MESTSKKVVFKDRVEVYATDKCSQFATGQLLRLHPVQAEDWIKNGKASKTKPEPTAAKPAGKPAGKGKGKEANEPTEPTEPTEPAI